MIHILTLSWNGLHLLKQLKPGLESNLQGLDYQWYIRDNGSIDGTIEEISKWNNVKILDAKHNRASFAEGVNSLFDLVNPQDEDLILLLNNDINFKNSNSIKDMISLMNKTNAGMVGCRMMYPNTDLISHIGVIFSSSKNSMPWHLRSKEKLSSNDTKNRYFQAVTAACVLTTAKNFRLAGKLDIGYRWAFEDIDLCLTLHLNHHQKIAYCGSTEIEHGTSVSLEKNPVHKLFMNSNVSHFKKKWAGKYKIDEVLYLKDPNYNLIV